MELIKKDFLHRRDFVGYYRCEACSFEMIIERSYDDRRFLDKVIPNFYCPKCKKSSNELGIQYKYKSRYPEDENIIVDMVCECDGCISTREYLIKNNIFNENKFKYLRETLDTHED